MLSVRGQHPPHLLISLSGVHPALEDADKFASLVKAVTKKLGSKGKVTFKKLRALALKKLMDSVEGAAVEDDLMEAIKKKVSGRGGEQRV